MISPSDEAENSTEPSIEELRASRHDALRQAEVAEGKARLEGKAHTEAAEAFMKRADEADAQARKFDAEGKPLRAAPAHLTATDSRKLAEHNYALADEKGAIAAGFEREAYHHRSPAAEFEAQILKKMEE